MLKASEARSMVDNSLPTKAREELGKILSCIHRRALEGVSSLNWMIPESIHLNVVNALRGLEYKVYVKEAPTPNSTVVIDILW